MVYWLKYYDTFYERVASQMSICDVEIVKPEMVVLDFVVDAFMEWVRWKFEQRKHERADPREPHEARAPSAREHEQVYTIAIQ